MNDFLEGLKAKGAKLAEGTAKVAGDLVEKGKTQVNKISLENDLAKAQRQLGMYVYDCKVKGESDPEEMERLYQAIAAINDELALYKAEDMLDREVKAICPQCGAEVRPDATFCMRCGTKLSDE